MQSSVCQRIVDDIQKDTDNPNRSITCISMDYFYRDLGSSESELARTGNFNFDHPGMLTKQKAEVVVTQYG